MDRKVKLIHSASVLIFSKEREWSKISKILSHNASTLKTERQSRTPIPKHIKTTAETKSPVIVVTSRSVLFNIERTRTEEPTNRVRSARGVYEVRENIPFEEDAILKNQRIDERKLQDLNK